MFTTWLPDGHDLLRAQHLAGELFAPFPHRLVSGPVNKLHKTQPLEVWALVDFRPHAVRQRLEEKGLNSEGGHSFAKFMKELEPLIEVMIQRLHLLALGKVQELCAPCKFDEFVTPLELCKEPAPKF